MRPCYLSFRLVAMVAIVLSVLCSVVTAGEPNETEDILEMDMEELINVPVIVSASRQEQKITEASVPVSIITAEDIHYSGLTNIAEILQFTPGVDMLKINRFNYAVGVHGLHETVSDRVQLLINGRLADSTLFGGPEFSYIPILLEDIDRIEIIRGPGGAAWGANAFTGVINIITKKPEDVLGYFGSTTINEFGDSYTHLRWAAKKNKWSWRISAGYEDVESSDDALGGHASYKSYTSSAFMDGLIGFNRYVARDFARTARFDIEAVYRASKMTEISLGTGYSHFESGDFEQLGFYPREDFRVDMVRSFAKVDHEFEDGSTGYLQWFGNFTSWDWPIYTKYFSSENDFETQLNFSPADRHKMSIGGNFRWVHMNTHKSDAQQYDLAGEPYDEYSTGLFVIDRFKATERLTLEGQFRSDWYTGTHWDWSTRLSALYALDKAGDHVLRVSFAKAFRAPLVGYRKNSLQRIPFMGSYIVYVLPVDKLRNEETYSLEAGYTGKIAKGLTLRLDSYYQRFTHLIGGSQVPGPGMMNYRLENIDGADSHGAECELVMEIKDVKLSAWYAYNDFKADQTGQNIRTRRPAKHKAGLTGRLFLPDNWTFNANYKFTNTTPDNPATDYRVASSHRLDLTISKAFAKGKGELMLGVSDLLVKAHDPVIESGSLTAHKTPGQTFFARVQYRF